MLRNIAFCLFFINVGLVNCYIDVATDQGIVRGYNDVNTDVYEFHGIPYATAPMGIDKFKPPLPAPVWPLPRNATDMDVICPQTGSPNNSEDCLVINVFTTNANSRPFFPVVVYIHGGAFVLGYGNSMVPRTLTATHDLVAVTFNYRLGPHGFLCLHTDKIPGNAGLRDQLEALKWVQRNIRGFGGDPSQVTLAGYSAGAASAELLMLSPASRNLFQRVLLESGNGAAPWAFTEAPVQNAKDYARQLGAPNVDDVDALGDYFANLSMEELLSRVRFGEPDFVPCIEEDVEGIGKIITENPFHTLQNGTYEVLPIMMGYTDAEGLLFYGNSAEWMKQMNDNFASHMPRLGYRDEREEQRMAALARNFYFGDKEINEYSLLEYVQYFTDITFAYFIIDSAKLHRQHGASVYLYEFDYVDSQGLFGTAGIGANHCAQSAHVLNVTRPLPRNTTDADDHMKLTTTKLWANFIADGDPWPGHWPQLQSTVYNYLAMNADWTVKSNPLKERVEFWDDIRRQINAAYTIPIYISMYILTITAVIVNY